MHRKKGVILTEKLDAYFTEKYAHDWKARGKAESILKVLRARFKKIPKDVEEAILAIVDPIALDSWAVQAATCDTLEEFAEALQ